MWDGNSWVDKGYPGGNCNCTGANWVTESFEPRCYPSYLGDYRAVCQVNDTSGDGPYGDDVIMCASSASVTLWPPGVVDWHIDAASQVVAGDGSLQMDHDWAPSCCGNRAHLDKVRIREYVTYEPEWHYESDVGRHWTRHSEDPDHPVNCFTACPPDPTIMSGLGSDDHWYDCIHALPREGLWPSYCQATQLFQACSGWENPPAETAEAPWGTLATHHLHWKIELVDGHHLQEIAKDSWLSWLMLD